MENEKHNPDSLNKALSCAVEKYDNFPQIRNEYRKEIKKCIQQGADLNYKFGFDGTTLLGLAVKTVDYNLLKYLIQHNADVNQKDNGGCIPLKYAIENGDVYKHNKELNLKILGKLCDAGTSLILNNGTIFHQIARLEEPKEYIETIITHARFYDRTADEQLKQTIKTMLLVFNRLVSDKNSKFPILPQEIKFHILSYLALDFSFGFNGRFFKKLIEMNCNSFIFPYLEKHVENIDKILKSHDHKRTTALYWWSAVVGEKYYYYIQVKSLLNGSKLRSDIIDFKNSFPNIKKIPKDNLILAICDVQKLLKK